MIFRNSGRSEKRPPRAVITGKTNYFLIFNNNETRNRPIAERNIALIGPIRSKLLTDPLHDNRLLRRQRSPQNVASALNFFQNRLQNRKLVKFYQIVGHKKMKTDTMNVLRQRCKIKTFQISVKSDRKTDCDWRPKRN